MAPIVPHRAQSPQQGEAMSRGLTTAYAGSELTGDSPDFSSSFLGIFRAPIPLCPRVSNPSPAKQ